MSRFLLFLALLLSTNCFSQVPQDIAIPLHVSTGINPPAVLISWENPGPSDIALRRRVKGAAGNTWTDVYVAQNVFQNGHFDFGLSGDEVYEYQIERTMNGVTAYGYAYANFFTPPVDSRGKLLVFIDSNTADELGTDLVTFKNDLRGEGWQTVPIKTDASTTVQWVKNKIVSLYNADPTNVKAVLLMGNIPIPYSGNKAWDNQPNHTGAWPCDAYYGDIDGVWTDNTVNVSTAQRPANHNLIGDGKFDQDIIPSAVELPVGRLDFRRLTAGTFGASPVELLRKYLLKNHLYRTGQFKVPNRALVDDHLGWSGGEAFAADGYRNAYPLTGTAGLGTGDFLGNTNPERYLLGYASGTAGNYTGATGIGTSAQVANSTVNVVFASLFGDYFGDWDYEQDPFMPSVLAGKGSVLACTWAGRPHWMQQGLAAGETIGFCLKETQNARYNSAYGHYNAESGVHISLLGDPTLRAQIVSPVTNLTAVSNCNKVNLHWTAAPDSGTLGYAVYRSLSLDGPYTRISQDLVTQTFWDDVTAPADTLFYAVRAMKLEVMPGGGAFYNFSTSPIQSVIFVPGTGPTAIGLGGIVSCSHPMLTLGTNFQPPTSTWAWLKPDGQPLGGFVATEPGVYTVVVTAPNGCTVAAYATVNIDTLLPLLDVPSTVLLNCSNPEETLVIPPGWPGVEYTQNGVTVNSGDVISLITNTQFVVSSTHNGCSDTYNVTVQQDFSVPALQIGDNGLVLGCTHSSAELTAISNVPLSYNWSGNGQQAITQVFTATEAGEYCCTVTAANGCTASACTTVSASGTVLDLSINSSSELCNATENTLTAHAGGGTEPYVYTWSTGASGNTVVIPAGFTGAVTVSITDAGGCNAQSSVFIAPVLSVFALTTLENSGGVTTGAIDLLISGGQAPFAFQWSNGATTEDVLGLSGGIYTVTVTSANGCTAVLSVPLTVGVNDVANAPVITILPNPVRDRLTVRIESADGEVALELRDLTGRLLASQRGRSDIFFFDTTILPDGMYVLGVETISGKRLFKVAVAK